MKTHIETIGKTNKDRVAIIDTTTRSHDIDLLNSIFPKDITVFIKKTPVFISILCATTIYRTNTYIENYRSATVDMMNHKISNTDNSYKKKLQSYCSFFLSELSAKSTINYFSRNSIHHSTYPDDIDDTFSALYIIALIDGVCINPDILARVICSLDEIRDSDNSILFNTWFYSHNSHDTNQHINIFNHNNSNSNNNDNLLNKHELKSESGLELKSVPINDNLSKLKIIHDHVANFKSHDIVALSAVVSFFDIISNPATDLKEYLFQSINEILRQLQITKKYSNFESSFYHTYHLPVYLFSRIIWSKDQSFIILKLLSDIKEQETQINSHQDALNAKLIICTMSQIISNIYLFHLQNIINNNELKEKCEMLRLHIHFVLNVFDDVKNKFPSPDLNHNITHSKSYINLNPSDLANLYIEKITRDDDENTTHIYAQSNEFEKLIELETKNAIVFLKKINSNLHTKPDTTSNSTSKLVHNSISHSDTRLFRGTCSCDDTQQCFCIYSSIYAMKHTHIDQTKYLITNNYDTVSPYILFQKHKITEKTICDSVYVYINELIKLYSKQEQIKIKKQIISLAKSTDYKLIRDILVHIVPIQKKISISESLEIHLIGLLGYYLYDKITEGEMIHTFLPIAIFCIRNYVQTISELNNKSTLDYKSILNQGDIQFTTETHHLLSPLEFSANKSIGICILPSILHPEIHDFLYSTLKKFQLIRQICDDVCDETKDMNSNKFTTMNILGTCNSKKDWPHIETILAKYIEEIEEACTTIKLNENKNIIIVSDIILYHTLKLKQKIDLLFFEHKTRIRMNICNSQNTF